MNIPLSISAFTRVGWCCAYSRDRVEPHEPPNSTHCSIFRCLRSFSMSSIRFCVLFVCISSGCVDTLGRDFPHPLWSNIIILYFWGLKNVLHAGPVPPPGPPCTYRIGIPFGFPLISQYIWLVSSSCSIPVWYGSIAGYGVCVIFAFLFIFYGFCLTVRIDNFTMMIMFLLLLFIV